MNTTIPAANWLLEIRDSEASVIRSISGTGNIPERIEWDGRTDRDELLKGGMVYFYQITASFENGMATTSPRKIFGVTRSNLVSLNLAGGAFEFNSAELSADARAALVRVAEIMRLYPEEKIIIDGHSDSIGSEKANLIVSRRRGESAKKYLVNVENINPERIEIRAYGEAKPIASNALPEGRTLNRRVEIRGQYEEILKTDIRELYRAEPTATINGNIMDIDSHGRFTGTLPLPAGKIKVTMSGVQGKSIETEVSVPTLNTANLEQETRIPWGATSDRYTFTVKDFDTVQDNEDIMRYRFAGNTDNNSRIFVNGAEIKVHHNGSFLADLNLAKGENLFSLMAENQYGCRRLTNLRVNLEVQDERLKTEPADSDTIQANLPPAEESVKEAEPVPQKATRTDKKRESAKEKIESITYNSNSLRDINIEQYTYKRLNR